MIEEILQVGVHNPFSTCFDFLPNLAEGVLCRPPSPVSEVGVIEHRLEDRFQSVQQCLLTYPIIDRRDAQHPPFTRLAGLRDALLPDGFGSVTVGAELLMQSGQALFEHFAKRLDAFTINPSGPMVGSDAIPCDLQILPLVYLVDERVNLPHPRRIDPVHESPRPVMSGSFTEGTFHLTGLAHLVFWLSSTVFAGWLPRHTLSPHTWSRGFHRT